jgi:hypothetical protein
MTPTPIFPGRVDEHGTLKVQDRHALSSYLTTLAGKDVDVIVRKHIKRRSDSQNRSWWGLIVPAIAEHLGYDRHEYEMVHYALVAKCFGVTEREGIEVPNARSSALTTAQFTELMDWAVRYAATEWGLVVPLPNEPESGLNA